MPRPAPTPPDHLLTPRQALVFMLAILVGLAAGILPYLAEMPAPHAVLLRARRRRNLTPHRPQTDRSRPLGRDSARLELAAICPRQGCTSTARPTRRDGHTITPAK